MNKQEQLRRLPAVHRLLRDPVIEAWKEVAGISGEETAELLRCAIEQERKRILHAEITETDLSYDSADFWLNSIKREQELKQLPRLVPVLNGTGVILHTNLGRAVLSERAIRHMIDVASGYSNLEYSLGQGKRGSRHDHVEERIAHLMGTEAAMVVNNNAAAVFLVLRELATKKEVIVSRGQLVEIGGSFRISEIMAESGAILREVGTTNRTHPHDYERAITENTALLMKVHTSNFRITGFTREVTAEEMAVIGQAAGIPVYEDLGSGLLYDLASHGIGNEPLAAHVIKSGVDIITCSGDKLLGGPQAGIIAGKKTYIDRLKKNQLVRMLRVDKVTLAALEATLMAYAHPEQAVREIPVLHDILRPADEVKQQAEAFARQLQKRVSSGLEIDVCSGEAQIGGGTMPDVTISSWSVSLRPTKESLTVFESRLRTGNPPVVGRIQENRLLLDFRTIFSHEHILLMEAINRAL